jgi:hypothetical protein
VPRGTYLHLDPRTGRQVAVEEFDCAVGPAGWRYVSGIRGPGGPAGPADQVRVDLTLDGAGRQVRVEVATTDWVVRGGVAGREAVWVRRPAAGTGRPGWTDAGPARPAGGRAATDRPERNVQPVERVERAVGFTGVSPAFLVATAWLLRRASGAQLGGRHVLRLVEIAGPALSARTVEQAWTLAEVVRHDSPSGEVPVCRWDVDDLAGGVRSAVHVVGDVLVAAPGVELSALDSPPSLEGAWGTA